MRGVPDQQPPHLFLPGSHRLCRPLVPHRPRPPRHRLLRHIPHLHAHHPRHEAAGHGVEVTAHQPYHSQRVGHRHHSCLREERGIPSTVSVGVGEGGGEGGGVGEGVMGRAGCLGAWLMGLIEGLGWLLGGWVGW